MKDWFTLAALALFFTFNASANPFTRQILPPPKIVNDGSGQFALTAGEVRVEGSTSAAERYTLDLLKEELGDRLNGITLRRLSTWARQHEKLGAEGYILSVSSDGVVATATTARGLFYAAQTLIQLAHLSNPIAAVEIQDWPDIKDRMVLYDLRFNTMGVEYTKHWIRELSRMKINQFMIFMSGDYQYVKYPFIAGPEKLTPEKLAILKDYAIRHHVELIPQLETLGHGEGVLKHDQFREMRLGEANVYAYSPCTEKTYSLLDDLMSELVSGFDQNTLFHVGGDEVGGFDQDPRCKDLFAQVGEAGIYSQHFKRMAEMVRAKNRRMAIWGDMLLARPEGARDIPRDTIIFDWHYQLVDDFPSLKFFKDLGFTNIFAAPAVWGHWDVYPQFPMTFQNIPGFTRAALKENIRSVCVTVWEMHYGGNAENYLYGVAFSGQVMWSAGETSLAEFNRRFANFWFGINDDAATAHVDRVFWMPWRVSGSSQIKDNKPTGYWQQQFLAGKVLYAKYNEFISGHSDDELLAMRDQRHVLANNLSKAAVSRRWLRERAHDNQMTLDANETASVFYKHMERKAAKLAHVALKYREAVARRSETMVKNVLRLGLNEIKTLQGEYPTLRAHLHRAIDERNSTPQELEWLAQAEKSSGEWATVLSAALTNVEKGAEFPKPDEIGL